MMMSRFLATGAAVLLLANAFFPEESAAQGVVQALPDPAAQELNAALLRLSRDPQSMAALVDAGRASLALNDIDAALGFFSRAQAVNPGDGRVLAGLALVALKRGDAVMALQFFADADAAGHSLRPYAADRALAFDLVGRNGDAQRLYRQALQSGANAEVTRRLALSYAISGDRARSESVLLPLLQRQDAGAYRTRAFALAILGREDEAVAIAETMLPARLSGRLAPYLRYMPRLTRAQQANAANLGRFPAMAQIGVDAQNATLFADEAPPPRSSASPADARLIPEGRPMGEAAVPEATVNPPIAPAPAPTMATAAPAEPLPPARAQPIIVARIAEPPPIAPPAPVQPVPARATEAPSTAEPLDLAEAFADFSLARVKSEPSVRSDVVDITAITPRREAPPPPPAPPPPAHPSRHWVQIATGQDIAAFRFDWRRLKRGADSLLDDREPYRASWGRTNRLVTGPFENETSGAAICHSAWRSGYRCFPLDQ